MPSATAYQEVLELSQSAIAENYAPLVKRIAYHLLARLPQSVQVDDLIQSGMLGLLDAASNFDASRGASFETYASIRIRGSMIDEMRRNDWTPRSVHRNARMIEEARRAIENIEGRDAKDYEIAQQLDLSLEEYQHLIAECKRSHVYGFDDLGVDEARLTESLNIETDEPLEGVTRDKFRRALGDAITKLPEREQIMLSLYYSDELNLKEIGLILGVSESRVCQIHAQAVRRLNDYVKEWDL